MKIGIIGCGNISETYFKSQNLFNNFKVIACADINNEVAKKVLKRNTSNERIIESVKILKKNKIKVMTQNLIGLPI